MLRRIHERVARNVLGAELPDSARRRTGQSSEPSTSAQAASEGFNVAGPFGAVIGWIVGKLASLTEKR